MAYTQILQSAKSTTGIGGSSSSGGGGGGSGGGGGEVAGEGSDFSYTNVTTVTTFGESGDHPAATDTVVYDLPATVDIRNNLNIILTINITGVSGTPSGAIPVFMEASADGTNWTEHGRAGDSLSEQLSAGLSTTVAGVHTFLINTENMNFPRVRFGFNSNNINLNGMDFSMGLAYVDAWVNPARHRTYGTLQGE